MFCTDEWRSMIFGHSIRKEKVFLFCRGVDVHWTWRDWRSFAVMAHDIFCDSGGFLFCAVQSQIGTLVD